MNQLDNILCTEDSEFDNVEVKSFTKKQILESNYYKNKRDILNVVLDHGQRYSIFEVNRILDEFYGGDI